MATAARSRYQTTRPRNDAYTGLLFISFLALVASCIFLYLDYDQYGKSSPQFKPEIKAGGTTGNLPGPGDAPTPPVPMGDPMAPAPMNPMPGPMNPMQGGPMNPGLPLPGKPAGTGFDAKGAAGTTATTVDTFDLPPLSPTKSGTGR
jgi:hypothetical protein